MENVKEIGANQVELTLKIEKSVFDDEVMKAYKKNVGKINVPGFRRGKAPKAIIEKMYGQSFFYDQAIDSILPEIYSKAVDEAELNVVSRPEIDVVSIDDNGVVLTAKVYTKPVAVVSKYKGLEAEKEEVVVTDEDIDSEIMTDRKRNSRLLTVTDRPAEKDDKVIIDFEGFVDDVPFEGGKAEKQSLVLGSGSYIPGFEDQIIGHSAGETFDITVKFPEDYGAEHLAGREAVFKITLHEIKYEEIPELNDDFVKEVSDTLDTVDAYKADIKAKITERRQKAADKAFEDKLIDALIENTRVEIPQPMIDAEIESEVSDFDYRLRSQGGSLEMYYKYTGYNENTLRESFKPQAERRIRTRLALEAVIKAEGIAPTPEEIEEEYNKIAESYKMETEKVKSAIKESDISEDINLRKAVELIKENAITLAPKPKEESKEDNKE
ncbi:MAG: trigger factor [Clostridiales bacterium]|jgi:trigger factor|nr:trigger factor [Clostridiales bacterium]